MTTITSALHDGVLTVRVDTTVTSQPHLANGSTERIRIFTFNGHRAVVHDSHSGSDKNQEHHLSETEEVLVKALYQQLEQSQKGLT